MNYKSIIEILEAEDLSLTEAGEALEQYLKNKNMTIYEFLETEEGRMMLERAERRFWMPMNEKEDENSHQK